MFHITKILFVTRIYASKCIYYYIVDIITHYIILIVLLHLFIHYYIHTHIDYFTHRVKGSCTCNTYLLITVVCVDIPRYNYNRCQQLTHLSVHVLIMLYSIPLYILCVYIHKGYMLFPVVYI